MKYKEDTRMDGKIVMQPQYLMASFQLAKNSVMSFGYVQKILLGNSLLGLEQWLCG